MSRQEGDEDKQGYSLFQNGDDRSLGATGSYSTPCVRSRLGRTGSSPNPWHPSARFYVSN